MLWRCLHLACIITLNQIQTIRYLINQQLTEPLPDGSLLPQHIVLDPDFLVDVWGTPHCADVNISFNQNGEFVFNDYDKNGNYIAKEGTFDFKDNKVILHYKDGDSLILKLKLLEYEEFNDYYLYTDNKSHYLVKGLRVPSPEELDSLTSLIYCEDK